MLNTKQQLVSQEIKIAPNPTTDFLNLSGLVRNNNYVTYNILGAIISKGSISDDEQIDVQELESGVYFINFEGGESKRFVKD